MVTKRAPNKIVQTYSHGQVDKLHIIPKLWPKALPWTPKTAEDHANVSSLDYA